VIRKVEAFAIKSLTASGGLRDFLFPALSFASELRRITGVIRNKGAWAIKSLAACSGLRAFLFPALSFASELRSVNKKSLLRYAQEGFY